MQKRILVEILDKDLSAVASSIEEAAKQGGDVFLISYGDIQADFANVYPHDMSDKITLEYDGRWIVFSADDSQVVTGAISFGDESRVAWTMHQGLVMPITEVMIHDLYIVEMLRAHRDILETTFGKDLIELRKDSQSILIIKSITFNSKIMNKSK